MPTTAECTRLHPEQEPHMPAYAFAQFRTLDFNSDIVEYLTRIDATLLPHGGRFLVHNAVPEVMDGTFEGLLVLLEFPSVEAGKAWYASEAYQAIVGLRIANSEGGAAIVEGVAPGYRAASAVTGGRSPAVAPGLRP
jgi:uncharacterized protein (DUF1330 family)